ncbi:unnamed protein product [Schistosoma mattheei]|uniref:Uncharacterized protein n=1 Tax=Schistosoma mattheei TaxID=31246 RepID=A0A3P8I6C2_9TREM|nr:unnamed protein product [Schistosoma mattheei]
MGPMSSPLTNIYIPANLPVHKPSVLPGSSHPNKIR